MKAEIEAKYQDWLLKAAEDPDLIAELEEELKAAYAEIDRLNAVIKELENKNLQPVEEPIDQSPKVDDNVYSKQGALKYFQ